MSNDYNLSKMPDSVRKQYEASMRLMQGGRMAEEERVTQTAQEAHHDVQKVDPEPTPPKAENRPQEAPKPVETQKQQVTDPTLEWQHKYSVLQGKYNAEVPRLHQQLKVQEVQVAQLMEEVGRLRESKNQEPQGAMKELMETFGADDPQIKLAQEYQAKIAQLESMLSKLNNQVGSVVEAQTQTAEDGFYAALDRSIPEWQEINIDPALMLWLDEEDELLGGRRKQAFDDAVSRLDSQRVAAFFKAYKRSTKTAEPEVSKPKPSEKLAAQVTPAQGQTTHVAAPAAKWTREGVSKFFADAAKQNKGMSAEDLRKITREIMEAQEKGLLADR